jgi:hypothetical protein
MSRKIGVNLSIDVKSIDKARLVQHQNGKVYLNMTAFIDPDSPGAYGDHGMITQDVSKEEKDQGVKGAILGNAKVFWQDNAQQQQQGMQQAQQQMQPQQAPPVNNLDDVYHFNG